jgi:single-strand DNA-binding protein
MSVNKVILVGRVGVNPELKNLDAGNKVTNFTMATSEYFKDKSGAKQEKTEWHNIVAWGTLAEIVAKNVVKGTQLYIEGKIQNRSYEDKDGVKKYTSEVVAENVRFLGSKKTDDGETSQAPASAPAQNSSGSKSGQKSSAPAAPVAANADSDDDLPF